MNFFKKLIESLNLSNSISSDEIKNLFREVMDLLNEIDEKLKPLEINYEYKFKNKYYNNIRLSKDENIISATGHIYKKIKILFQTAYDEYKKNLQLYNLEHINKTNIDRTQDINLSLRILESLIDFLKDINKDLDNTRDLLISNNITKDKELLIIALIKEIEFKLNEFIEKDRQFIKIEAQIEANTMDLIEKIIKTSKTEKVRKDNNPGIFTYNNCFSKSELRNLSYLPLIDVTRYNHKHSSRTNVLVPVHRDKVLNMKHYNLEFEGEPNIHIIPKEYLPEFNKWLELNRI